MASLTETSIIARKIIRFGIYGLTFLIFLRTSFSVGKNIYRKLFPEPPPKPTVTFGKLPNLSFPEGTRKTDGLSFTLETAQGALPVFSDQQKIYLMPKSSPAIGQPETAKFKAQQMGFNPKELELVETVFQFQHPKAPATLVMNIVTQVWSISFDLRVSPYVLDDLPPDPDRALAIARSFLSQGDFLKEDLEGRTTHEYLKVAEGKFVTALSRSDANLIKVNLFRKDYETIPPVTLNPKEGNVWFLMGGSRAPENQIIAAEYHYYPIEEKRAGTYPIKTSQAAWDELTKGEGFVADMGENKDEKIVIRNVYLGYFDPGQYSEFYQPVYVFEGDNNFTSYVPAVTV